MCTRMNRLAAIKCLREKPEHILEDMRISAILVCFMKEQLV